MSYPDKNAFARTTLLNTLRKVPNIARQIVEQPTHGRDIESQQTKLITFLARLLLVSSQDTADLHTLPQRIEQKLQENNENVDETVTTEEVSKFLIALKAFFFRREVGTPAASLWLEAQICFLTLMIHK